jgi:hypothetical protein
LILATAEIERDEKDLVKTSQAVVPAHPDAKGMRR